MVVQGDTSSWVVDGRFKSGVTTNLSRIFFADEIGHADVSRLHTGHEVQRELVAVWNACMTSRTMIRKVAIYWSINRCPS